MSTDGLPLHLLVPQCLKEGETRHWEDLVARLQPVFARAAYRVAASFGRVDADDVDDIIQETFLRFGGSRQAALLKASFQDESSARAYFMAMAGNVARDYFRAKYAQRRDASEVVPLDARMEEIYPSYEQAPDRQLIMSEIEHVLPADERSRTVFWLYYRQGLTAKEIASIPGLDLTVKGVESLLYRLTSALKKALNAPLYEGESGAEAF